MTAEWNWIQNYDRNQNVVKQLTIGWMGGGDEGVLHKDTICGGGCWQAKHFSEICNYFTLFFKVL